MGTKVISRIRASNKYISAILLATIMLITIAQVLMRSLFNIPFVGIEELSRYFFISFIFLGLSYYNRVDGHIKLEGLQKNFPLKVKRVIGIIIHVSSVIVFAIITFSAIYTSLTNYNSTTQTLAIPFWLFFLPTIVGFALLTVEEIIILVEKCKMEITAWE